MEARSNLCSLQIFSFLYSCLSGEKFSSPNLTDSSITHLKAGVFQSTIFAHFLPYISQWDDIQSYGFNFDKYAEDSKIVKPFPEDTDLSNYI